MPNRLVPRLKYKGILFALSLVVSMVQIWPQSAQSMDHKLNNDMTLEQIDKAVRKALPKGIALSEIEKYFVKHSVEYGYYKKNNQVFAAIRNIRGGGIFVSKDARITITLDRAMKLESLKVEAVMVGL